MDERNTFTHNGKTYNLDIVRRLVRPKKAFLLRSSQLLWILKYDVPREERVLAAKTRYPLLVTRWKGRWVVIDGIHRLERYRRKGITVIPVKEVDKTMLNKALIE